MPVEAETSQSDALRRSKRNKFHLDVAGMHGSRRSASHKDEREQSTSSRESPLPPALSPHPPADDEENGENGEASDYDKEEEIRRGSRMRKVPQRLVTCYTHDSSSDDDKTFVMTGDFCCSTCPMRFTTPSGLARHTKMHIPGKTGHFSCESCNFSCESLRASQIHRRAHRANPSWTPESVPRQTDDEKLLLASASRESSSDEDEGDDVEGADVIALRTGTYQCDKCPMRFIRGRGLASHKRHHRADEVRTLQCAKCDFSCESIKAMKLHLKAHELQPDFVPGSSIGTPSSDVSLSTTPSLPSTNEMPTLLRVDNDTPLENAMNNFLKKPEPTSGSMVKRSRALTTSNSFQGSELSTPVSAMNTSSEMNKMEQSGVGCLETPLQARKQLLGMSSMEGASISIGAALKSRLAVQKPGTSKSILSVAMLPTKFDVSQVEAESVVIKQPPRALRKTFRHKCSECPFTTHLVCRLEPHLAGHRREAGYKCPHCTYKSESSGFLKRHIYLHAPLDFIWPPIYVKGSKQVVPPKCTPLMVRPIRRHVRMKSLDKDEHVALQMPRMAFLGKRKGVLQKEFVCPVKKCGYQTRFLNKLITHKKVMHRVKFSPFRSSVPCFDCGTTLHSRSAWLVHKVVRHQKKLRDRRTVLHYLKELSGQETMKLKTSLPPPSLVKAEPPDHTDDRVVFSTEGCDSQVAVVKDEVSIEMKPCVVVKCEPIDPADEVPPSTPNADTSGLGLGGSVSSPAETPSSTSAPQHKDSGLRGHLKCAHCPYLATNKSRLYRHESKHIIKSENKCNECSFSCHDLLLLGQHMRLHNMENEESKSEGTSTPDRPSRAETETPKGRAEETKVPRSSSLPQLKRDSEVASPSSDLKRKDNEQPVTPDDVDLNAPKLTMEPSITKRQSMPSLPVLREKCSECPYRTKHSGDLKDHVLMHRLPARQHQCPNCTYSTKRTMSLQRHLKWHEIGSDTSVIVSHQFYGKLGFKRRMDGALRNWYICSRCPFETSHANELWKHARYHLFKSSRSTSCPKCKFASISHSKLLEHMQVHPNFGNWKQDWLRSNMKEPSRKERIPNGYLCKECPFATETYNQLYNHIQRHRKPGKFKCERCSFGCNSDNALYLHYQLHAKDKTSQFYHCVEENCKFKCRLWSTTMAGHYETKHPDASIPDKSKFTITVSREEVDDRERDEENNDKRDIKRVNGDEESATPPKRNRTSVQQSDEMTNRTSSRPRPKILVKRFSSSDHLGRETGHSSIVGPMKQHLLHLVDSPKPSSDRSRSGTASPALFNEEDPGVLPTELSNVTPLQVNCYEDGQRLMMNIRKRKETQKCKEDSETFDEDCSVRIEEDGQRLIMRLKRRNSRDATSSRSSLCGAVASAVADACSAVAASSSQRTTSPGTPLTLNSDLPDSLLPDPASIARRFFGSGLAKRPKIELDSSSVSSGSSSSSVPPQFECLDEECPYVTTDPTLFDLHAQMHAPGRKRPQQCTICSYSCFSVESLHTHIELHIPDGYDKRVVTSSSRRLSFKTAEVIPEGADVYECNQCSYRSADINRYKTHMHDHAQTLANRLMTQIKRNNSNLTESWTKPRLEYKKENSFHCHRCGFSCCSAYVYQRHCEMHGGSLTFTCELCDYTSNTYNVVAFHQIHHHLDQPLTHLMKHAKLGAETNKLDSVQKSDEATRVRLSGQQIKCLKCEWTGFEMSSYADHFKTTHMESEEDQETALYLSMDLIPKSCVLTSASA